jgi:tRNA A58 N-methylase Trm61
MLITNLTYKIECRAAGAGAVYRLASQYYRDVIEREAILANITAKDHILCIGGGICPFSAILFHRITGAKVTVIDNNADCIPKAEQVIAKLGIGDFVSVLHQDGADIELSAYSVIHLALQVAPMDAVLAQVMQKAAAGARMLIRQPKKTLDVMYDTFSHDMLAHCPYVSHKSRNIGSTVLYTKLVA